MHEIGSAAESDRRRDLESEVCRLYQTQANLQKEIEHHTKIAELFQSKAATCLQGLNDIVPGLEELRKELSYK
jgi:hypothetical protein